jgi:hypothetical protein
LLVILPIELKVSRLFTIEKSQVQFGGSGFLSLLTSIPESLGWHKNEVSKMLNPQRRDLVNFKRKHGTQVVIPANGEDRIQALRDIIEQKQYAKIDNCMIDLFSASTIVQVFDALSKANQDKFSNLPAPRMAQIAFEVMNHTKS